MCKNALLETINNNKNISASHLIDFFFFFFFLQRPDIWFDDVDEDLLDLEVKKPPEEKTKGQKPKDVDTKENSTKSESEATVKEENTNPLVKERATDG